MGTVFPRLSFFSPEVPSPWTRLKWNWEFLLIGHFSPLLCPDLFLANSLPFLLFLQHSTSVSIMGFSNTLEMELSSNRLTRTLEPQIQSVSSLTTGTPQTVQSLLSGSPPTVSSLANSQNQTVPSLTASHLQPVPSLMRGAPQSMLNPMSESSLAIPSLANDRSQPGPTSVSTPTESVTSLAACPHPGLLPASDTQSETGSSCSSSSGRGTDNLCPLDGPNPSLGTTLCKVSPGESHSPSFLHQKLSLPFV